MGTFVAVRMLFITFTVAKISFFPVNNCKLLLLLRQIFPSMLSTYYPISVRGINIIQASGTRIPRRQKLNNLVTSKSNCYLLARIEIILNDQRAI